MYAETLQVAIIPVQSTVQPREQEQLRRRRGVLTQLSLRDENVLFEHSRGLSLNNARDGFVPGFRDGTTGELAISRFADGSPAPLHVLDGLPEHWVSIRDDAGHVLATRPGLVSGFIRDGRFYTREEAARAAAH